MQGVVAMIEPKPILFEMQDEPHSADAPWVPQPHRHCARETFDAIDMEPRHRANSMALCRTR